MIELVTEVIPMEYLPGTKLKTEDISLGFSCIAPSLAAARGFTLSQVCAITGVGGAAVQNWVKRGWVTRPANKRYGEYQLARIMLINMLRDSMSLEKIALLLHYINGEAQDRGDDIIPDSALYTHLCGVINACIKNRTFGAAECKKAAMASLESYNEVFSGVKNKLCDALTAMTLAYISGALKKEANRAFSSLQL